MKKFFTSLMALTIAMSASAGILPIKKDAAPVKKTASVSKMSKIEKAQKAAEKEDLKVASPTAKSKVQAQPRKSAAAAPKLAKFAKAEEINVTFSEEPTREYYEDSGDWFMGIESDDKNYVIKVDYLTTEDGKYGTYTLEDLDLDYSYITDYVNSCYVNYTDANFTISREGETNKFDGTFVGEDGNTYKVSGEWGDYQAGVYTWEMTSMTATYYSSYGEYAIKMSDNEGNSVVLWYYADETPWAGTFGDEAMDDGYDYVQFADGTHDDFTSMKLTTIGEPEGNCEVILEATGSKGDKYYVHFNQSFIVPTDTVKVNTAYYVEWPSYDLESGAMFNLGNSEDASFFLQLATKNLLGEMTQASLWKEYSGVVVGEESFLANKAELTVAFDAESYKLSVKGYVICENAVCYDVDATYQLEAQGKKNLEFSNLVIDDSYAAWFGVYFFDAANDSAIISGMYGVDEMGDIDMENFEAALYTIDADGDTLVVTPVTYLSGELYTTEEGAPGLKYSFLGDDMVTYNVDAFFTVPEVTDTVSVTIEGAKLNDLIADMGAFQVMGYDADSCHYASVVLETLASFEGEYDYDDMETYASYCYVVFDAQSADYELANIYAAELKVTKEGEDEEGNNLYKLAGTVQAGTHLVNLVITFSDKEVVEGNEYDMEDQDVTASFTSEDIKEAEADVDNGYYYIKLFNGTEMFATLIYTSEATIAAGTYEINDTYEAGSVQAGQISGSSVYPTFYGTVNEEGYINVPLFFCVAGTVTVSYGAEDELKMTVNATNTWGRTATITLNGGADATGIESVAKASTKASKNFKNGMIRIEKNGKAYNVAGIEL